MRKPRHDGQGTVKEKPPAGGFDKHGRDLCLAFGVEALVFGFKLALTPWDALLVAALDLVENPLAFRLR